MTDVSSDPYTRSNATEVPYQTLVELSGDIIYVYDAAGMQTFINKHGLAVLGATPEEVIGQPWAKWIHPEDVSSTVERFTSMIASGEDSFNLEHRLVSKDGRVIPVLHSARVLRDDSGNATGVQGIARDISELQHAQTSLDQRVLELSTLNQVAQAVATITDLPKILDAVTGMIIRVQGAQGALIGVLSKSRLEMTLHFQSAERSDWQVPEGAEFHVSNLPGVLEVLRRGKPIVLEQSPLTSWPPQVRARLSESGIVKLMLVPMRVRGEPIGILAVGTNRDDGFADWQTRLAETVAAQVAGAVKTAAVLSAERRQRQKAESLQKTATTLAANLNLATVMDLILIEAGRVINNVGSGVYLLDAEELVLSEASGVQKSMVGRRIATSDSHPVAQIYRGGPAFIQSDADTTPEWAEAEEPNMFPYWAGAPLIAGGSVLGVLAVVVSRSAQSYKTEDARTLQAFAAHAATAIANAQYVQQTRHLAVVEERQRIARELHDSITQLLYSMALMTRGWQAMARSGHPPEVNETYERLNSLAQQTLREARLLIFHLRPVELSEMGLAGALRSRLDLVEKRAGIEARLETGDNLSVSQYEEEQLYHIAIEALNNSLRHSGATAVKVRMVSHGPSWTLEVIDNGKGFDLIAAGRGLGLANIKERAEMIDANVSIDSTPEQGTRIAVTSLPEGHP